MDVTGGKDALTEWNTGQRGQCKTCTGQELGQNLDCINLTLTFLDFLLSRCPRYQSARKKKKKEDTQKEMHGKYGEEYRNRWENFHSE